MPITPYNAPIQYEYKPLNLSSFAVPLAKMQEDFDVATAKVGEADFDLANLPYGSDPEKAKKLKELVTSKRDELAKNLAETKNYKAATSKIKELQTLWSKDPEKLALESNYKLWQERDKAERERIDKPGGITRDQYLQWYKDEINKYEENKGASFKADYNNEEGTYNKVTGQTGRLADLSKDLEEMSWKVANAVPSQRYDAFRAAGFDVDTRDKKFIETVINEKEASVVAQRVSDYLKTLPRFRDWANEVSDYNFKDIQANPDRFNYVAKELNNKYIGSLDYQIKKLNKDAESDKSILNSKQYKDLLEEKQQAEQAKQTGVYDVTATKNLFQNEHLNNVYDMGALGNVFAYKNIEHNYTFRDMPEDDGSGDGTTPAGGVPIFTPLTENNFDIPNLNKQKTTAAGGLYESIKSIRNIGKGAMGGLILGATKQEKEKLANNPATAFDNANKVMTAYQKSLRGGNKFEAFKASLKAQGLKFDGGQAWTTYQALSTPGSTAVADLNQALESGAQHYDTYTTAKTQMENLENTLTNDGQYNTPISKEYKAELQNFANKTAYSVGAENDRTSYTYNELAKQKGFKNFQDALSKGFDFSKYDQGWLKPQLAELKSTIIKKNNLKSEMSYGVINNTVAAPLLGQMFRSSADLESYVPAYQTTWKGVEGFTEDGKVQPGTVVEINKRVPPIIEQHGNKMFYNVAVDIKTPEGTISKTITVTPKKGSQHLNQYFLNSMDNAIPNNGTKLEQQSKDHVKLLKFNEFIGGTLSPQTFDNTDVIKNQQVILQQIDWGNNGETVNVVKEQSSKYADQKPTMRIYISNPKGGADIPVNDPATGKPFRSSSTNDVKTFLAKQLNL
jgi:hypothetical protein